eukprot:gene9503-10505_t
MYSKYSFVIHGIISLVLIFLHKLVEVLSWPFTGPIHQIQQSIDQGLYDLRDKVVIVTGANTGIGKETARKLVSCGATVILACRDDSKGLEAVASINAASKTLPAKNFPYALQGKAQYMRLDLGDLHSVLEFSKRFHEVVGRLDILVNNAGLNTDSLLPNGLQQLFQVNYLGHYLLVRCLYDLLSKHGQSSSSARVINLSSVMHHEGQPNFKLSALRLYNSSMRMKYSYYSDSKLYMNLLTLVINRRWSTNQDGQHRPILALSANPGAVRSDIWRNAPLHAIWNAIMRCIFLEVEEGCQTSFFAATMPEEDIRNYMTAKSWSDKESGRMCLRGDIPYLVPYAVPTRLLAWEMMGPYAGPRFSYVTIPLRPTTTEGVRTDPVEEVQISFRTPVDLANSLWKYSAETCHRVLLQSGVSHEEIDFLLQNQDICQAK